MEKKGTGAEHVSYRHNVFRNKMLGFEKILFIIMLSVNILYIIVSFADKNLPAIMTEDIIRLISVTAVQIISCCSFRIINSRDNFSNETKNRMCCISLVGLFAAEELLFYFCEPLWVGTAVVMVISSFFNDRKTIFVIYATSIAVWIASAFMYNYSASSAVKALDVRDFAATFLLISCVFAISVILYNFNKLQVEDVVEYYDGEKKLQEKLSTDYLTQLHTRFSIYENIKQAMHDYYFSGKDVCVAMLDIDFFKKVNDTYGHDKGDMVLRTLSRVISQYTDDTIHAGRYGGEEFLILFSGYTRKQAGKILEGMLTNFRNQEYDFLPEDVIITFSAGFTYLDNKNIDVEGFIKCADEALYYSKEHGRNQITYYNDLKVEDYVRSIPDFPEPGIIFRDVTSVIQSPEGLKLAIDGLTDLIGDTEFDVVVGPESRGFIFGVPVAYNTGKGFVPVRKKGKLPCETISADYELEYGTATIEMHKDAITPGQKVIIVDDLIATGGTTEAIIKLVEELGGEVVKVLFLMELEGLKGRDKIAGYDVESVIKYPGK